jgi:prepilin-type N-terminal cleavage/methylation domain-containing protein
MRNNRRQETGFTLMELMVVIVIVAILAAVAVPLYINYVKDAQRTEAKGAIGAVVTAEQVYYQQNPGVGYTQALTNLNVDLSDISNKWIISVENASITGFKIKADEVNGPLIVWYEYDRTPPGKSIWTTEADAPTP